MSKRVICPHCATILTTTGAAGQTASCPQCKQTFVLRTPNVAAGPGLSRFLIGGAALLAAGYAAGLILRSIRRPGLFISHAWDYNDEYYRLVGMLEADPQFEWANHSVPEHAPLSPRSTPDLERQLESQVSRANVVLVISGMYANHREWIQKEIDMAVRMGKPIIGVKPWGAQRVPDAVEAVAVEMVGWRTSSIVDAIVRHAK